MMRKVLLIAVLFAMSVSVQAQQSETTIWHWAVDNETNELFAYAPTGEVNLLTSDAITNRSRSNFWRISDSQAIGLAIMDDQKSLYILDETSIEEVNVTFDYAHWQDFFDTESGAFYLNVVAYHHPYIVFTAHHFYNSENRLSAERLLFLDLSTQELHLLSEFAGRMARFSEAGDRLRYAHYNITTDGRVTIEIRQYLTANASDSTLYSYHYNVDERWVSVSDADAYGTRWLIYDRNANPDEIDDYYYLFSVDRMEAEQIYARDPEQSYESFRFVYDDLFSYGPICIEDCVATVQTSGGRTLIYPVDNGINASVNHVHITSANIEIYLLRQILQLDTHGNYKILGVLYRGGSHLPSSVSPDGRYALLADDDTYYPPEDRWMMDFETDEQLFSIPDTLPDPLYMTYLQDGFLIKSLDSDNALMFRYGDSTYTELPSLNAYSGAYFAMLPEDTVLHYALNQITLYNPATDEQTILLDNVRPIRDIHIELVIQRVLSS